jgi:TIR domain
VALLAPWREKHEGARRDVSADQIFISYRHADAGGWARSLHDSLEEGLGPGRAFRDVAMPSGMDFHQHAESLLDRCDVVLAIIGKRWTSITGPDGTRRLDNPDDLVRREIARALQRPDVQVIPVLVDGALMPTEAELPPDLASLSRRLACELTDTRWDYDVDVLTRRLRELLGEKPPRRLWRGWPVAAALVAAIVVGLVVLWPSLRSQGHSPPVIDARIANIEQQGPAVLRNYLSDTSQSRRGYTPEQLRQTGTIFALRIQLRGERGTKFPLRWFMTDADSGTRLPGRSFNQEPAVFQPRNDNHSRTWPVWIPDPPDPGRYRVTFMLDNAKHEPVAQKVTPVFRAPSTTQ